MISDRGPDADATVVRYGLRWLLWVLPWVLFLGGLGVGGLLTALLGGGLGGLWLLPGLFAAVFMLSSVWGWRGLVTALDTNGFWVLRGKQSVLIPWESLAGVGLYWAGAGKRLVHTVELCPRGDIDRDDPLLWEFVRDRAPLRDGLPRLRYRFDVRHFFRVYEEALRRWAPELWFGRIEQPASYLGQPDRAGHRQRTAARLTRPEP